MAEWRNKQRITQKATTFNVCVLITAILLLMRSKFEQLPERNIHFQSQPNVSLEFQTFCPDVWKSHSVATGTPPAEEKNATTLKGHLLTYAGSRSRGEPMVLALLLTYSSWNRTQQRGVLDQNPRNAAVMTGDDFLFGLHPSELPAFVGHINVLF